jgi:hypothetical protein
LEKALVLTEIIRRAAPVYRVQTKINAGDLEYADEDRLQPLQVTVYDELDRVSILRPVLEAQLLREGRPTARSYTRVYFDVELAGHYLDMARRAAKEENGDAADRALRELQWSVVFEYDPLDAPLARASETVLLAKNLFEENKAAEARTAVAETVESLEAYEKKISRSRAEGVRSLIAEIKPFATELDERKTDFPRLALGWWDRLVEWFSY